MPDLGNEVQFWHWWILALGLLAVEAFFPGAIFLWMGISAAVVGCLLIVVPALVWEWQALWFGVLSIVSVLAWRGYRRTVPAATDQPNLNKRGHQYVGRVFTLAEPIVNGHGKIKVDDTTWKISGADCDTGIKIEVVGVDGIVLEVEIRD